MFAQEALAIVMAAVGPQGKSGVPEVAQVAHDLAIGRPAKVGLVQDCLFQLGVGDLALRHGSGDANRAKENDREENSRRFHFSLRSHEDVREPLDDERRRVRGAYRSETSW